MARYNKIFAGPFTEATPQVREAVAGAAILPGIAVGLDGSGEFVPANEGKLFVAQDNYLTMKGVDDEWSAGDRAIGMEVLDAQFFNVRVADSQNVSVGDALTPDATGVFTVASGPGESGPLVAEESFNNTTGETQLVRARVAIGFVPAA